jgi:hypothetical protein
VLSRTSSRRRARAGRIRAVGGGGGSSRGRTSARASSRGHISANGQVTVRAALAIIDEGGQVLANGGISASPAIEALIGQYGLLQGE